MTEIPTHAQTLREDFDKWFRRATGKPGGSPAVNQHGGTSLASGGFSRRWRRFACLGQDTDVKDSNQ